MINDLKKELKQSEAVQTSARLRDKMEIENKFYKLKVEDKLNLTGKQLKEFAEYNRNSKEKEMLDDEIRFLSTYYNKTANKSKLIEERLSNLKERRTKL